MCDNVLKTKSKPFLPPIKEKKKMGDTNLSIKMIHNLGF